MKKVLFIFLYSIEFFSIAFSQTDSAADNQVVELKEVVVGTVQKHANDHLLQFYKANNSTTLDDIIGRLPEMNLVRRGEYGMEPAIRCFNGGQVNVLVDGMRMHGACTDKMDPVTIYIEPINLQNLQVQTSNKGFVNGSSIGGTLNMKIAEPEFLQNKKLSGTINSGYQTAAKGLYESTVLNYSSGKWAFRASGTYRNSQNYRAGGGDNISFSQFRKTNYSMSAKYEPDNNTYIKTDLLSDDGWNIGYPALPMDVGYAAARIAALTIHKKVWLHRFYNWETKVYGNYVQHYMDDTHRPSIPMHMDMPGISHTIGAYSTGILELWKKQSIIIKADASSTYLKASMTMYQSGQLPMYMLTWPDNNKNQYGIGASWQIPLDSTLNLHINSRADLISYHLVSAEAKDQVRIFGYSADGRADVLKNLSVSANKKLNNKFNIAASLAYTEREPTASELYGFYLFNSHDGYDYIGNPEIKKENALQGDITFICQENKSKIQLTGFYSHIFNYIFGTKENSFSAMTIGANGVKTYAAISNVSVTGAEATFILKPFEKTDLVSTLKYTYGKTADNKPLPYIAPFKNVTSLRYQSTRFSLQMEYEAAAAQNRASTDAGEMTTPGYILLNLRSGYGFIIWQKQISLQTGIENILDKNYREHLDWGNIPRPGRNIYVQLRMNF